MMVNEIADTSRCGNYIIQTLLKIDRIQKDATIEASLTCQGCDVSLVSFVNNTIPVSLFLKCCNYFTADCDQGKETSQYFRVESIREKRYATLQLLENQNVESQQGFIGTGKTCILDLEEVIALQCYEPCEITPCND